MHIEHKTYTFTKVTTLWTYLNPIWDYIQIWKVGKKTLTGNENSYYTFNHISTTYKVSNLENQHSLRDTVPTCQALNGRIIELSVNGCKLVLWGLDINVKQWSNGIPINIKQKQERIYRKTK